jgi:hypothetical protein
LIFHLRFQWREALAQLPRPGDRRGFLYAGAPGLEHREVVPQARKRQRAARFLLWVQSQAVGFAEPFRAVVAELLKQQAVLQA